VIVRSSRTIKRDAISDGAVQQCHAADRRKRACGSLRRFAPQRRLMASVIISWGGNDG
jgi:hypothetical protein